VLECHPGDVVVTERVQGAIVDAVVVVVRMSQAVLEKDEYRQRDEQHGERGTVGHRAP